MRGFVTTEISEAMLTLFRAQLLKLTLLLKVSRRDKQDIFLLKVSLP